jgi:hypothetical protein
MVFSVSFSCVNAELSMPKVFEWNGYRFFFFSNEGTPLEPCHIHVRKGEKRAKFWLDPIVCLAESYEMHSGELSALERVVEANDDLIRRRWHEHLDA